MNHKTNFETAPSNQIEMRSVDQLPDLDEAIEKCKIGKHNYLLALVSGCLLTCGYTAVASLSFVLPNANCDLNFTTQERGIIGSIGYVGVILSSSLWGYLSDTKGRRAVLIPNLYAAFLAALLASFVTDFWLMLILRFFGGFLYVL